MKYEENNLPTPISVGRAENLTGQKKNRLTILYRIENQSSRKGLWLAKCDCGNYIGVRTENFKNGHTQSCGCLYKKDISNQKFGKLTALYPTDRRHYGSVIWHCRCDCGNECNTPSDSLISGHTASCGCLRNSLGEFNIKRILNVNKIKYKEQYTFSDLKDKKLLRFDFAILDKNNKVIRIIEFDGKQHYEESNFFTQTLKEQKERDYIKNQYCKDNNIPLVRIPYWERDSITLEMLLGKEYEIEP